MQNPELMKKLTAKKINVLAMDAVPRISRAQALMRFLLWRIFLVIVLSLKLRMNSVASLLGKLLLQVKFHQQSVGYWCGCGWFGGAIGAANSLGAIVRAFDSRPEVKEQVQSIARAS